MLIFGDDTLINTSSLSGGETVSIASLLDFEETYLGLEEYADFAKEIGDELDSIHSEDTAEAVRKRFQTGNRNKYALGDTYKRNVDKILKAMSDAKGWMKNPNTDENLRAQDHFTNELNPQGKGSLRNAAMVQEHGEKLSRLLTGDHATAIQHAYHLLNPNEAYPASAHEAYSSHIGDLYNEYAKDLEPKPSIQDSPVVHPSVRHLVTPEARALFQAMPKESPNIARVLENVGKQRIKKEAEARKTTQIAPRNPTTLQVPQPGGDIKQFTLNVGGKVVKGRYLGKSKGKDIAETDQGDFILPPSFVQKLQAAKPGTVVNGEHLLFKGQPILARAETKVVPSSGGNRRVTTVAPEAKVIDKFSTPQNIVPKVKLVDAGKTANPVVIGQGKYTTPTKKSATELSRRQAEREVKRLEIEKANKPIAVGTDLVPGTSKPFRTLAKNVDKALEQGKTQVGSATIKRNKSLIQRRLDKQDFSYFDVGEQA